MPRKSYTIDVAILNITLSPHQDGPDSYRVALKLAAKEGPAVPIRGDTYGLIRSCNEAFEGKAFSPLTGELWTFMDLNTKNEWFNDQTGNPVTEKELAEIKIPAWAKPKLKQIRYVFFPDGHTMFIVTRNKKATISPKAAGTLVEKILNSPKLQELGIGYASVTVVPESKVVDQILSHPLITQLCIEVNRPNPDEDYEDNAEQSVASEMEAQGATKLVQVLESKTARKVARAIRKGKAVSGLDHNAQNGIKPNGRTQKLAQVAERNGKVQARVIDEGQSKQRTLSTEDSPQLVTVPIAANQGFLESFLNWALNFRKNRRRIGKADDGEAG